ncbi:MAG: transcriptional repressor [Paludibacteraceae bacterium]|nr:transcriptional repressor [Paludibacteraceae bacterium]
MKQAEEILSIKGVKPTANRVLVLRTLLNTERPVSLSELEDELPYMDKSSIFRTLTLFKEHHVTHEIDDGTTLKYEACHSEHECSVSDMHTHFHCEICQQTFCLHDIQIPTVQLPEGYETHAINYMIKGICPQCAEKRVKD